MTLHRGKTQIHLIWYVPTYITVLSIRRRKFINDRYLKFKQVTTDRDQQMMVTISGNSKSLSFVGPGQTGASWCSVNYTFGDSGSPPAVSHKVPNDCNTRQPTVTDVSVTVTASFRPPQAKSWLETNSRECLTSDCEQVHGWRDWCHGNDERTVDNQTWRWVGEIIRQDGRVTCTH